jgi:Uma2 family endonuclease
VSLGLSTHHGGPWTETDYFALGERGDRIELIDGGLLITPTGSGGQRRYARALANLLDDAAPGGFEVLGAVNVRVGRDRVLIPDIVVTNRLDEEITFFDAADIALVVEIASPSNATTDRVLKSHLYAAAGIETYLRVELGEHGPVLYEHRLAGSAYALVAEGGADNPLALVRPYPVEIDPGQLLRRR